MCDRYSKFSQRMLYICRSFSFRQFSENVMSARKPSLLIIVSKYGYITMLRWIFMWTGIVDWHILLLLQICIVQSVGCMPTCTIFKPLSAFHSSIAEHLYTSTHKPQCTHRFNWAWHQERMACPMYVQCHVLVIILLYWWRFSWAEDMNIVPVLKELGDDFQ